MLFDSLRIVVGFEFNNNDMIIALKETKQTSNFKNIREICSMYWGWSLPDYSPHRQTIAQDYDIIQIIYPKIEFKGRTSNINNQYILYELLTMNFIQCSRSEFKIPITEDIILSYEILWDEICINSYKLTNDTKWLYKVNK